MMRGSPADFPGLFPQPRREEGGAEPALRTGFVPPAKKQVAGQRPGKLLDTEHHTRLIRESE
eukprot:15233072-Heterocapsa_arctica.AAC.1